MAQGKLKVKAKLPHNANKKGVTKAKRKSHTVRKGNTIIPPKKKQQLHIAHFKKDIQKNIRKNIEAELSQKAKQVEEGRGFSVIDEPGSSKSK